MKKSKKMLVLIFAICSVVIAAAGGVLLTWAIAGEYDVTIGHFDADAVLAPVSYGIMAAGVVLAAVLAVLSGKSKIKSGKNAGVFLSFSSVFAAILLFASVIFGFFGSSVSVDSGYNVFMWLSNILGIAGAVSLFIFALSGSYRTGTGNVLSFCLPIYFIMRTLILYFDKTVAINSPVKVITQIAFIVFALFTTFDAGVYVGKEKMLPRYLFGCVAAVTVGGTVSLAALVSQFIVEGCFELSAVDTCMMFAFFLLACAKLHHAAFAISDNDEVTEADTETEPVAEIEGNESALTEDAADEAEEDQYSSDEAGHGEKVASEGE